MQIIVLGMHRSGTSAVARLLNMMGAYFGPAEQILPPSDFNLKGYWERKDVNTANEEILQSLNSSWSEIANIDIKQLDEINLKKHVDTFAPIIRELDTHRPWMVKDPRLCLTLPIWQPLLEMPVYILVYRHPVHIARSLKKREDLLAQSCKSYPLYPIQQAGFLEEAAVKFPFSLALGIWEKYTLQVLQTLHSLENAPKILVSYHKLLADPVGTVQSLYACLGDAGVTGLRLPSEREIQAYINPDLCHADTGGQDDNLTAGQQALVRAFEEDRIFSLSPLPDLSMGSQAALVAYRNQLAASHAILRHRHELTHQKDVVALLQSQQAEREATVSARLQQQEAEANARLQQQEAEAAAQCQTLNAQIQQQTAETTVKLQQAAAEIHQKDAAIQTLQQQATHLNERIGYYKQIVTKTLTLLTDKELALLHKDNQINEQIKLLTAKDQEMTERNNEVALREEKLRQLNGALDEAGARFELLGYLAHGLEQDIDAVFNSLTWKAGSVMTRVALALIFRKPGLTAENHIGELRQRIAACTQAGIQKALVEGGKDALMRTHTPIPSVLHHDKQDYKTWVKKYDTPTAQFRQEVTAHLKTWQTPPLISVILPVYNTPEKYLRAAIDSVRNQWYPYWELCIADDASDQSHIRPLLEKYAQDDPRIKVCFREQNGHISAASNTALELAEGDYIAFLDHDDTLAETALFRVAQAIVENPEVGLIYSDEDKLDAEGARYYPHFKPAWNPDLLLSYNYINHLTVYARGLVETAGGLRTGFEGAQDYDLLLRVTAQLEPAQICHIPYILYHWRATEDSTASRLTEKPYAWKAAQKAIAEALQQQGVAVEVGDAPGLPGFNRVKYTLPAQPPRVTLIIPTHNQLELLRTCIDSLVHKTDYLNYEILIVDNNSDDPATLIYLDELAESGHAQIIRYPHPFNYAAINNMAVKQAQGEFVCLLNNDVEIINPDWLGEMMSHALRPGVGFVGARLWYANDTLQHGGVILGIGGVAGHSHKYFPRYSHGYFSRNAVIQNLSAVTAACMVVRKDRYLEVEGMETQHLQVAFNDVDFCLKLGEAGYRGVWTPYAELYHHESVSRGQEDTPEKTARFQRECAYMKSRWGEILQNDPAYNPNLNIYTEDFAFAQPPRVPHISISPGISRTGRFYKTGLSLLHKVKALVKGEEPLPLHLQHRQPGYELLRGHGIEIGAFNQPARLPEGCTVEYCDVASDTEISQNFKEIDPKGLVKVDHIYNIDTETLPFGAETLDFGIMNHVLEHVANPIQALEKLCDVIKPGGHWVVSIPDKRFTFDKPRALTPFEHLQTEYQEKVTEVTDEHYLDFLRAVHPQHLQRLPAELAKVVQNCRRRHEHAHVWDSAHFAVFLEKALELLEIQAKPVYVSSGDDNHNEYFAVWQKI